MSCQKVPPEGDFSTDLDLVQEVGRLINGLIRSLSAPATSF
jgi:hypothetical protein